MTTTPITVSLELYPLRGVTPEVAYHALKRAAVSHNGFLLESPSGPRADRKTALVGIDRLLSLAISSQQARLTGVPSLIAYLNTALASDGFPATKTPAADTLIIDFDEPDRLWTLLRLIQSLFLVPTDTGRFRFGWFGWFGYDTIHYIERIERHIPPTLDDPIPDIQLTLFQSLVQFDLITASAEVSTALSDRWPHQSAASLVSVIHDHAQAAQAAVTEADSPPPAPIKITDSTDIVTYKRAVNTALDHIRAGDIYQIQLGHQLQIKTTITPLQVYRRLRQRNPSPYMYLVELDDIVVVGASPEAFVKIDSGQITMRPLAGTIARGTTPEDDLHQAETLRADPKERSEHIMLVDLCRNDISRICIPESLDTTELLATEAYSHVFHLVSNVVGHLDSNKDVYDVIAATFPAGTMSGAPKIRAIEIIETLETCRRGLYAGTLGLIDFSGFTNMALCIRSTLYQHESYLIRASAGIVADSDPQREWDETLIKLNSMYWAITGDTLKP